MQAIPRPCPDPLRSRIFSDRKIPKSCSSIPFRHAVRHPCLLRRLQSTTSTSQVAMYVRVRNRPKLHPAKRALRRRWWRRYKCREVSPTQGEYLPVQHRLITRHNYLRIARSTIIRRRSIRTTSGPIRRKAITLTQLIAT